MKSQKNRKWPKRLYKTLNGSNGIVYLMFLGRETYAANIQSSLVGTIYNKDSSVNQAVQRLLKHGSEFLIFQRKHRENRVPGRKAEIYTASFDPISKTLQAFDVDFDKSEIRQVVELLSQANASFPQYLVNMFEKSLLRHAPWPLILASYFTYMSELLRTNRLPTAGKKGSPFSPLPPNVQTPEANISSLLNEHPNLPKKLVSISVRMSSPSFGLNPRLRSFLVEALPNIDQKLFETALGLQEVVDIFQKMRESGAETIMEYMERVRETQEFLEWKLKKEKKKG